eukprot:m.70617 g.70617  ORF g.70617 m.70617 type:complete len:691 (-) comp13782_c1_seq2:88-2160(-)
MDTKYIQSSVGPALADALAEMALYRPEDPIEWLAAYLRHNCDRQEARRAKEKEQQLRAEILKKAREEEERLAELMAEQERLANLRKPNSYQLDCMSYLQKITEIEKQYKDEGRSEEELGSAILVASREGLSTLELSNEARNLVDEPPHAIQQLIRAGMIISGYPANRLTTWADMSSIILNEYALERFEGFDIKAVANKYDLKEAVSLVDGVDFLARPVQKHPLGPLATRFHTYLKSALQSFGFEPSRFLEIKSVEEDQQSFQRTIWTMPDQLDEILGTQEDESEESKAARQNLLSTLAGLDHRTLPKEYTSQRLTMEVWWQGDEAGVETDADASLIMFSNKGQPVDNLYHLVRKSKDGAIAHLGDMGDDADAEFFMFNLSNVAPEVHVIAVVLNVATDGDSLEHISACGLRIKTSSSEGKTQETLVQLNLDASLINRHEVLLALIHRDKDDKDLWHMTGIGEQVKGAWRDEEESQNFLNALPLSQRYIELLGIAKVNHEERHIVHPFKMVPGDSLEVPSLAVETPVVIGMGWDVDPDVAMDLDCGLAVYSKGQRTDYCDFEKLVSNDNAIHHQGDNRDGEGEGDDESIIVEFNKLDPSTDTLFLYAAVYEGGALRDVENVHIRMLNKRGGKQKEICRFSLDWLAKVEDDTAVILAKISRTPDNTWLFRTIGTTAPGRTIEELESRLTELL